MQWCTTSSHITVALRPLRHGWYITQASTPYRAVPLGVHTQGEQVRVTAQVSGDFPQSPLQLEHVFQPVGGKIAALEIH